METLMTSVLTLLLLLSLALPSLCAPVVVAAVPNTVIGFGKQGEHVYVDCRNNANLHSVVRIQQAVYGYFLPGESLTYESTCSSRHMLTAVRNSCELQRLCVFHVFPQYLLINITSRDAELQDGLECSTVVNDTLSLMISYQCQPAIDESKYLMRPGGILASNADWQLHLPPYVTRSRNSPVHVLEVGVLEGANSVYLIDQLLSHGMSTYTAVDPFNPREHFSASLFDSHFAHSGFAGLPDIFTENIYRTGRAHQTSQVQAPFDQGLLSLLAKLGGLSPNPNARTFHYDVVFVNCQYDGKTVLNIAVLAWPLVAPGGIIIFDMIDTPNLFKGFQKSMVALRAFLAIYEQEYESLWNSPSTIIVKRK